MSAAAPYVTLGDTPTCDACHAYYAERRCEDCAQLLCTWCNLDQHQPIGKRNHYRPRLYGEDEFAHMEAPAISSADRAIEEAKSAFSRTRPRSAEHLQQNGEPAVANKFRFDPTTGRVNVTTEHFLPVTAEEGWDLLGDWEQPYVPFSVESNDAADRREIELPSGDESADSEPVLLTEKLIQRDDREMFYSYSRLVPPGAGFPYTDWLSKFAFLQMGRPGEKRCCLQWTTSVMPLNPKEHKIAAEAVAKFQESWKPYFDAAINLED